MLNKFHVWFPGGIVIGAITSKVMSDFGFGWESQIAIMLIPTFIYGYLFFKEDSKANTLKPIQPPIFNPCLTHYFYL